MRLLALLIVALLVSSCAPTRYPPGHPNGPEAKQPTTLHLEEGGIVKRGNPYQIDDKWYYPLASGENYDETGIASWYGDKFHGLKTANGEVYNMYAMTAAHTTLPMPSLVRVTNLENGKSVVLRVNDRGPFAKSRIIDLSFAAAKALGTIKHGTARVRIQTLQSADVSAEKVAKHGSYEHIDGKRNVQVSHVDVVGNQSAQEKKRVPFIQMGAFSTTTNAQRMLDDLQSKGKYKSAQVVPAGHVYRVRLGPFDNIVAAEAKLHQVKVNGYDSAMIIHD